MPEDALADGVHAVEHGFHAELLGVDAALFVDHRVAQKSGGDALILGRRSASRSPAICSMMKLVVGQIAVERVDHPVAIEPDAARLVLLEAVGVGIARRVEPVAAPALAVVRRRQQPVDLLLVGVRDFVGQERIDFFDRRRQADQIETQAAEQRDAIGLGGMGLDLPSRDAPR